MRIEGRVVWYYYDNMDDPIVNDIVNLIKPIEPKKVILYGSRVRGVMRGDSDVDLCLVLDRKVMVGDKAKLFMMLNKGGFDWQVEPDFYLVSDDVYQRRLEAGDLFTRQVNEGRVVYESR